MISRLGYALLALLARQSSTGYELSERTRRPLGYFWSARHSQVYPELQKLLDGGWVRFDAEPGPGPRNKKVYSPTEAGLERLREWLTEPPGPSSDRDELVLKAYASWTAPAAAGDFFASQVAGHRERLSQYEADCATVQARHGGPPPATHRDFGNYATLRFGLAYQRERIAWLEWLSQQLSAASPPD